jgi:hypothetical protein
MRRVALGCLLATAGLAIAGTTATALSTHAPEEFNQTLTLAGGPAAPAPADDPDAPIATARYGGERTRATQAAVASTNAVSTAATVALAGSAPGAVELAGAPKAVATPALADATPAKLETAKLETAKLEPARGVAAPAAPRVLAAAATGPVPRPVLSFTRGAPIRPHGKPLKLEVSDQPLAFTPMGLRSDAVKRLTLSASNFMSKAVTSAEDLRRGRWMLFAASSGKAYGLSLIRDTFGGWRNAGVSEEKLASFGSRQIGVGYHKNSSLIALSATQRKFRGLDYADKDTVVGVSVSVRGR